jgi:hypothetical protein
MNAGVQVSILSFRVGNEFRWALENNVTFGVNCTITWNDFERIEFYGEYSDFSLENVTEVGNGF